MKILWARWKRSRDSTSDVAYVIGNSVQLRCMSETCPLFVLMSKPVTQGQFG